MPNEATLLLDLDGVSVIRVERLEDGTRRVHLATAEEAARACPECGAFAWKVKGTARTRPRDLPYGEHGLVLLWHKRRWWCREPTCPRTSFTESVAQIPAGARITTRLRQAAGRRVRDAGSTVIQAARDLHLSWPTVTRAFRASAREVVDVPLPEVHCDRERVARVPGETYMVDVDGLRPSSEYTFTVRAEDGDGSLSPFSREVTVTTLPDRPDEKPPTRPEDLRARADGSRAATLTWREATDDTGVTSYDVLQGGTAIHSVTDGSTTTYEIHLDGEFAATLVWGARHAVKVRAKLPDGHWGAFTPPRTATTP
ncbi:transposase family protein [Streptomyces sp. GSL17-111]|uniref:transposase family protein n=1 Tax=Streptomyces sp. GSL17-111 TaxID=3121596 RepID=UPI0030F4205A